jgi:hypothetical protein
MHMKDDRVQTNRRDSNARLINARRAFVSAFVSQCEKNSIQEQTLGRYGWEDAQTVRATKALVAADQAERRAAGTLVALINEAQADGNVCELFATLEVIGGWLRDGIVGDCFGIILLRETFQPILERLGFDGLRMRMLSPDNTSPENRPFEIIVKRTFASSDVAAVVQNAGKWHGPY